MPPTYTEKNHAAEFIHSTANANRSFDNVMLTGTAALEPGTVLGRTIGGPLAVFDPTASDGTEIACAILINATDPRDGDVLGLALTGEAEVNAARLVWPFGITNAQKIAAQTDLLAYDIKIRT